SPLSNLQQEVLGNSPTSRSATPSLDHPTSPSLEEGTSYGSPNESTIGLLEDLASNLASGQSSPAQSEIYVQGTPQDFGSTYSPTPSSPGSPIPLSYSLGTQGPTRPIYGDEHTPPPPDVAGIPTGLGQDKYNTYQPRNKYLQQLFSYNHVQAKDHTFRGSQATSFIAAAARCASRYTRQPTEKHLLDFLLLPKAGLTLGIQSEEFSTQYVLQHYPDLMLPPPNQVEADRAQEFLGQPDNRQDNPCSRAQRLVEKGYLGRAARALVDPSALARNSAEILAKLREKHPVGQPHPFTSSASPRPGPRPVPEDVLQALASFAPDTAPGLSGWSVPLLREACKQKQVVDFLTHLCKQVQNGLAPGSQLLTASRLVALDKEDNGVRPIAVGELQSWYWTVLGTGPPVRTASSRSGPVLDSGTGRPVLSRELPVRTGSSAGGTPAEF
ncbi:hypothetical protein KCU87_g10155, partial [Aureobasidium melanogenum]